MVGAIGFEPIPTQPFQTLARLGWQPKDRNGSQRNNNWTRIGHCRLLTDEGAQACLRCGCSRCSSEPRPPTETPILPVGTNLLALMIEVVRRRLAPVVAVEASSVRSAPAKGSAVRAAGGGPISNASR